MKNKIFVFAILFCLIFVQGVSALGITPGRTSVDFSPNLEREVTFSVVNTESKDIDIAFSVEGDLTNYINISNEVVSFSAGESSKSFKYSLKLPTSLSPGIHKAKIIATELAEDLDGDMVIKATVSVATQIYVSVPYPGKFVEANFNIVTFEDTDAVNFYVPFISRGEEIIESVDAVVDIYKRDEKIGSLNTTELSFVKTGDRKELSATWNPEVAPGEYLAKVVVDYDGEKINLEKEFNVGYEDFEVLGISVNNFKLGDVAKLEILIQNKLSDSVEDVFADLKIYDGELEQIADLESANYDIPALSNKEMIVYWDTEYLEEGIYGSELKINHEDKFISKTFKVDVSEDMMIFSGVGFVVSSGGGKVSTTLLLGIVIGFLVLVNLLWFVWWMKRKRLPFRKRFPGIKT